eukprot:5985-Amphidinium_carterae.1
MSAGSGFEKCGKRRVSDNQWILALEIRAQANAVHSLVHNVRRDWYDVILTQAVTRGEKQTKP